MIVGFSSRLIIGSLHRFIGKSRNFISKFFELRSEANSRQKLLANDADDYCAPLADELGEFCDNQSLIWV